MKPKFSRTSAFRLRRLVAGLTVAVLLDVHAGARAHGAVVLGAGRPVGPVVRRTGPGGFFAGDGGLRLADPCGAAGKPRPAACSIYSCICRSPLPGDLAVRDASICGLVCVLGLIITIFSLNDFKHYRRAALITNALI